MSRFDELFNVTKKEPLAEPPKSAKISKSKDPNYIRTTVYLPKELHRLLKSVALEDDLEMSAIVEASIFEYLKSRKSE